MPVKQQENNQDSQQPKIPALGLGKVPALGLGKIPTLNIGAT